jgi:cyclic pyranopterin phosphate synthase
VGVIPAINAALCEACHRVRLTSRGELKACLLGSQPLDLLGPLRAHASHEDLVQLIRQALAKKPECLPLQQGEPPAASPMRPAGCC